MTTRKSKTKTIITLTTVPWMRHCGDWPTARLKHACLWSVQVPAAATVQFSYPVSICWCWSKRLNFPTMLLKCALVQFWIAVLSSSGRLARLNIHFCPRSPLIWFQPQRLRRMLNACSAYVATDGGQVEQNGKNLERRIFLRINLKYIW